MGRELLLWCVVPGTPRPQGSMKAFVVGGRARMIPSNKPELKAWRGAVESCARACAVVQGVEVPLTGALAVGMEFTFQRPRTVRRVFPTVPPDVDKLVRAVLDALTTAGVWLDDSQVVMVSARKRYGQVEGARVSVYREGEAE